MSDTSKAAREWARALAASGITRIFGVPGGGPNLMMVGAAEEMGIEFTLMHAETPACITAGVYGRATGTCGVVIVTRGPGLTSAVNGIASTTLDRLPLAVFSDTVAFDQADRIAHQRLDQPGVTSAITKSSGVLGSTETEERAAAAIALAMAQPPGAVHLDFDPSHPATAGATQSPPEDPGTVLSLERISSAQRPVVIVGTRVDDSLGNLAYALDQCQAPILATYHAKGAVDETAHPSFAGMFTGVAADHALLQAADLIVGIGVDTVEPMPGDWPHAAKTVLVNPREMETTYFNAAEIAVGPLEQIATYALDNLGAHAGRHGQWDWQALSTPRAEMRGLADTDRLTPLTAVVDSNGVLPDAAICIDAGAHMLAVMQLWPINSPAKCAISNGLATMGYALPAAIGLALARPTDRIVCHVGDGGLMMCLGELETISRLGLKVSILVYNDSSLSLIKLKQRENQGGDNAVDYSTVNFSAIASAMGIASSVVSTRKHLRSQLAVDHDGPVLIDMRLDYRDYPPIMRAARG
jgi:acetolactate synthase-1/2/3 large subunit